MEEKIFEVDMIYIKNTSPTDYSIECASRRKKSIILNFSNADRVEINAPVPLEVKNAIMSCNANGERIWNMRFSSPANLKIGYSGKIIIQVI